MNKLSQLKKYWWFLLIGIFLIYIYLVSAGTFGSGTTFNSINLSGNDVNNWLNYSNIRSMSYDNVTNRLYIGTNKINNSFSWFDYNLNTTIFFNATQLNNLLSLTDNIIIAEIEYSYTLNRTFMVTTSTGNDVPQILWFNPLNNVTMNVSMSGCSTSNSLLDADLSVNKTTRAERLYVVDSGAFYYFDTQLNRTICLTDANGNDPAGISPPRSISYDASRNRTWIAGGGSGNVAIEFGFFDEDRNITMNLTDKTFLPNNRLNTIADNLLYDSFNDLVWFGIRNGTTHPRLFYFNITSNATVIEVNIQDTAQLLNTSLAGATIASLSLNERDGTLIFGMEGGTYGYFDLRTNRTYALNGSDTNDWVGTNTVNNFEYDVSRNNTYLSGGDNTFGVFGADLIISGNSAPTIINNYTNPLIPTLNNPFNITAEINGTDLNDGIIYVNFSIQASNGSILLNNVNGTINNINGQTFNYTSRTFTADDGGTWRWNYTTKDNMSPTEVFRSGQFTISDSTSPTINITHLFNRLNPNNTNFSIDTTYRIQVNWTGTDNIRLNTMWYIFNNNATNTTIPLYTNFTISIPFAGRHNVTLFANDTTGNIGSTFINFSVRNDTQIPSITITSPSGGTETSQTVTTTHSFSDDVEIYLARYSVYSGSTENIANRTITNPSTNTTLIYTTTLGCSSNSYTLYLWANDTSGNEQQTSSTYTCTTSSPGGGSPGGGGGNTLSLLSIGGTCISDSQCSSNLCDLSLGSKVYGQCVNSLCGNGVQDSGESFFLCSGDFQIEGGTAGFFIKTIPYILSGALLLLFLASNTGQLKKIKNNFTKWIKGF